VGTAAAGPGFEVLVGSATESDMLIASELGRNWFVSPPWEIGLGGTNGKPDRIESATDAPDARRAGGGAIRALMSSVLADAVPPSIIRSADDSTTVPMLLGRLSYPTGSARNVPAMGVWDGDLLEVRFAGIGGWPNVLRDRTEPDATIA